MIASIKEFLQTCFDPSVCKSLHFENSDMMKYSFAVIMWKVILSDDKITQKEINNLFRFYQNEFGLNDDETEMIVNQVRENSDLIELHVQNIENILKESLLAKAEFLKHVNALIICDGIVDIEYNVFEKIRNELI